MSSPAPTNFYPLLKQVSRSFYLTVRVLPRAVRRQIGLAYLLARASDTIADTEAIPVDRRLEALDAMRERIGGKTTAPLDLSEFTTSDAPAPKANADFISRPSTASLGEQILIRDLEEFLACLRTLSPADRTLVQMVLGAIVSGQELDLRRFGKANEQNIVALRDEPELDDYTYRVAGCVGEFWSRICRAHLFPDHPLDEAVFVAKGIRFGKGLQLVNILRDLAMDLRQGRCYLPADRLVAFGLAGPDLLSPSNYDRLRPLYAEMLSRAEMELLAGWEYTNMLPRGMVRVRLACAWPILIGWATLAKLRQANILDPSRKIKISRSEVRRLIAASLAGQCWPSLWARLPARARVV